MAKKARASQRRHKKDGEDGDAEQGDVLSEDHTIADSFSASLSIFGNEYGDDNYMAGECVRSL
jgi:hypothetical protein